MSVLDDPDEFTKNPLYGKQPSGDFSPFYIAITICTVLGGFLFILNIIFCCCSKYKDYWLDGNTGNRWLVSLWTKTPHKQPPLDLTELEDCYIPPEPIRRPESPTSYFELQTHSKRESDL